MLTIGETQAISHATEQQTQERRIVHPRRGRFDTKKSSGARTPTNGPSRDGINKQRSRGNISQ